MPTSEKIQKEYKMDTNQFKQIYDVMTKNGFDEIELRYGPTDRIRMVREEVASKEPAIVASEEIQKGVGDGTLECKLPFSQKTEIRSELVGVFQFMDDDEKFGPKVGDSVAMGEKLGKILSLDSVKIIKSPVDGRINEVAVKQNSILDYGRLLFVIEDADGTKV